MPTGCGASRELVACGLYHPTALCAFFVSFLVGRGWGVLDEILGGFWVGGWVCFLVIFSGFLGLKRGDF